MTLCLYSIACAWLIELFSSVGATAPWNNPEIIYRNKIEAITIKKLAKLKFGLSEKRTNFDKSADLLSKRQNHKADLFKLCVLFKKSEL